MSKTVFRYDRGGSLRSPTTTPQGFLRVDGHAARVGIYEYRRADGSIQYELRPREEVMHPDSLASYDAAPVTLEHPVDGEVTSENVRRHEVGTVSGEAREDGDAVAVSLVVKDAKAIKAIRAGKQELSPGYKIRLDETPGFAPEYASPSNPTGRYHAVQRDIRVNHQAIVDGARGGRKMRLRMDAMEEVLSAVEPVAAPPANLTGYLPRLDAGGKLTTSDKGHQHLVDTCGWDGQQRWSGETSFSMSEGADVVHSHPWTMAADGTITIGESEGHTHAVIDAASAPVPQGYFVPTATSTP